MKGFGNSIFKKYLFLFLVFQQLVISAQDLGKTKTIEPAEIEYVIFGSYSNVPTKANTTRMYKLTGTHLLRSKNGFFISFPNIPSDTLQQEAFGTAGLMKQNIPAFLMETKETVFGSKEQASYFSVYLEFKVKGQVHSAFIHSFTDETPMEIRKLYSEITDVLKRIP